jgi:hypothetical protein
MNITVTSLSAHCGASCGYVGIGLAGKPPLVTIYFGVTSEHPSRDEAEEIAQTVLGAMRSGENA